MQRVYSEALGEKEEGSKLGWITDEIKLKIREKHQILISYESIKYKLDTFRVR